MCLRSRREQALAPSLRCCWLQREQLEGMNVQAACAKRVVIKKRGCMTHRLHTLSGNRNKMWQLSVFAACVAVASSASVRINLAGGQSIRIP